MSQSGPSFSIYSRSGSHSPTPTPMPSASRPQVAPPPPPPQTQTPTPTPNGNTAQAHTLSVTPFPAASAAPQTLLFPEPGTAVVESGGVEAGPGASQVALNAVKNLPGVAQAWLGTIESNTHPGKDKETALIVPQGLDYTKPVKVLYYFHGWNGGVSSALGKSGNGLGPELMAWARKNNAVLAVPQGPAKDPSGRSASAWMAGPETFPKFNQDVLGRLSGMLPATAQIGSVELAGHSAGGIAVQTALQGVASASPPVLAGGRWQNITVGAAHFLDASYSDDGAQNGSNRGEDAFRALQKINPKAPFHLAYIPQTATDKGYSQKHKASYLNQTATQFRPISQANHSSLPKYYFSH